MEQHKPTVLVAVERPGASAEGKYQFVGGADVTERTAKLDYLFRHHAATIGIGDWGNEIGLANLAEYTGPRLPSKAPTITPSAHPIIAAVSNWGAYGLVAAISKVVRAQPPYPTRTWNSTTSSTSSMPAWLTDGAAVSGLWMASGRRRTAAS